MPTSQATFHDLAAPGVAALTPYEPGRPITDVAREYGVDDIVKLASNENPLGPSPRALEAARKAVADVHRYPDGAAFDLRRRLADRHGIAPDRITLGNGSNDVLDLVARAFLAPGRSAVMAEYAFAVYPIATLSAGAEPVVVPANAAGHEQPFGHDLESMVSAVTRDTRVVFVANPNNPTGTWLTGTDVERFLRQVPDDIVVVLDEAYVDYALDSTGYEDAQALLARHRNLVVTRTFSKIYGLAGLRVGYALSDPAIADLLNRVRHPFNVNVIAQVAAREALDDETHLERSVALNRVERERVERGCAAQGYPCLPSAGNFLCVQVGADAGTFNEALLRRGVIVRPLHGYGLGTFARVSIGTEYENDRFLEALRALSVEDR